LHGVSCLFSADEVSGKAAGSDKPAGSLDDPPEGVKPKEIEIRGRFPIRKKKSFFKTTTLLSTGGQMPRKRWA